MRWEHEAVRRLTEVSVLGHQQPLLLERHREDVVVGSTRKRFGREQHVVSIGSESVDEAAVTALVGQEPHADSAKTMVSSAR